MASDSCIGGRPWIPKTKCTSAVKITADRETEAAAFFIGSVWCRPGGYTNGLVADSGFVAASPVVAGFSSASASSAHVPLSG